MHSHVNAKHFWLASKLYIIPCSPCDESDIKILHDSQRLVLAKLICPCLLILNAMVLLHWLEYLHRKLCHLVPPGFRFCGHWDFLCIKLNVFSWSLVQRLLSNLLEDVQSIESINFLRLILPLWFAQESPETKILYWSAWDSVSIGTLAWW